MCTDWGYARGDYPPGRSTRAKKSEQAVQNLLDKGEIYNLPVVLFNFPVKQEKRCINPPLRAGDRVRVRVRVS